MARPVASSGRPLCRTGLRLFTNKLECLADEIIHQDLEEEETMKNISTPAIRYNVCRERTTSTTQKYQFRKSPQEDGSIKDVSAENISLESSIFENQNNLSKEPVHSPGYRQFQASSTYKNLVLPLKASKLSDPFPSPVKMMPSHTVSDAEKAQQMMAERRLPRSINKKPSNDLHKMSRKLSNFRQLSLSCDTPPPPLLHQKRRAGLTKQFSEDIPEPCWFDHHQQQQDIQISLNSKPKKPPLAGDTKSVKLAWGENFNLNEEVIIKKCKEVKRERGKLTRHPSLEKDSILNSKVQQEFSRPRPNDKENEKSDKSNSLQIYLAHNLQDSVEDPDLQQQEKFEPKYLQPLVDFNQAKPFQIKKPGGKKAVEKPPFTRSNTIVVVPLVVEKKQQEEEVVEEESPTGEGINVIIRPMTAQSRREKFQKRTNSAFHGNSKEVVNFRPPLVRSSSAPSTKQDKGKFLASKRKLKTTKRSPKTDENCIETIEAKEWKNAAQPPPEIVTMVSLISPSGSENEAESEDEKERPKSVLKSPTPERSAATEGGAKNVTLRKTVKSVSFQQSSIHAVRSFSASFPARRASMAAIHQEPKNGQKSQEKRGTNPGSPDADERVPKRRLLRSNTEESKASSSWKKATSQLGVLKQAPRASFSIDIQSKASEESKEAMRLDLEENVILITPEDKKPASPEKPVEVPSSDDTPKEKQCWAMYCKMTEKGINVSYDTILRGMLTPTEYRIRRKTSIAEEMNNMVNPPQAPPSGDEGKAGTD